MYVILQYQTVTGHLQPNNSKRCWAFVTVNPECESFAANGLIPSKLKKRKNIHKVLFKTVYN